MRLARFAVALVLTAAGAADAQTPPIRVPRFRPPVEALPQLAPPPAPAARGLREHFGASLAERLLHGSDAEERLRGLTRLAALGTPEAVSMLVHAARDPSGSRRVDTRALLVIARGLADKTSSGEVRQLFKDGVLGTLGMRGRPASPDVDSEGVGREARLALVRATAALALATSRDPRSVEALMSVAREPGPGQAAALDALAAVPPEKVATAVTGPLSPALLALSAELGDLRALDAVRAALKATDATTRAAALDAMVEMGDARAVAAAGPMLEDAEPRVREAAVGALVRFAAPERFRAVERLLGDEATARAGVRLAERAADAGVAKALAALTVASGDPELRAGAIVALGRCSEGVAVQALSALAENPLLAGDAAGALARSPAPGAEQAIEALARAPRTRRLSARAFVVRALTRGEAAPAGLATLETLASSPDPADRAVGASGLVLLGRRDALGAMRDLDASVRRTVATAASIDGRAATQRALLLLSRTEPDAAARQAERAALLVVEPGELSTDGELAAAIDAGEPAGPLSAMRLVARADGRDLPRAAAMLATADPVLRAHAARGLGECAEPAATGILARAYEVELDPAVRRAIVAGLSRRRADEASPSRRSVLRMAAHLDPDRATRALAARALSGLPVAGAPPWSVDVAWLRIATPSGDAPPEGETGMLLRSDGIAVPIAFDPDGYALVPTVPGEARLLLAPRIPVYEGAAR